MQGVVDERVLFVGVRPHAEIPSWLSMSDILVLPSHREGLPNVVLEAMSCRRPVIATNVGGIPEAVSDKESGIVIEPHNPIALAEAMERLALDPNLRDHMGRRGREVVMQRFVREKSLKQLVRIYKGLM